MEFTTGVAIFFGLLGLLYFSVGVKQGDGTTAVLGFVFGMVGVLFSFGGKPTEYYDRERDVVMEYVDDDPCHVMRAEYPSAKDLSNGDYQCYVFESDKGDMEIRSYVEVENNPNNYNPRRRFIKQ